MFYCSIKCVRIHIVAKLCCSQYDTQVGGSSTTGNQMAIEGSANAYCNAAMMLQQGVVNDTSIYQRTHSKRNCSRHEHRIYVLLCAYMSVI